MFTSPLILLITLLAAATTKAEPYLVTDSNQDISLYKRDNIVQGWALVEDACPQGTGTCGARSCCPLSSYCDTSETDYSNICCPTRDGCGYNVTKLNSRCAVDSWVLFTTNKDPICCMPGEIGTNAAANENYGHCLAAGANVPSASSATLIGAGATIPAALPSGYTSATGSTSSASTSAATAKTGSSSSTKAASGASTSVNSVQATTASTAPTATVTVKSEAGTNGLASILLLGTLFGGLVVL